MLTRERVLEAVAVLASSLVENRELIRTIRKWLETVVSEFGGAVYLVGSALSTPEPRDVDLRLILPDEEFEKRFGPVRQWAEEGETGNWTAVRFGWASCCVGLSRCGWEALKINIDFQIHPESWAKARYRGKRKMLLVKNARTGRR